VLGRSASQPWVWLTALSLNLAALEWWDTPDPAGVGLGAVDENRLAPAGALVGQDATAGPPALGVYLRHCWWLRAGRVRSSGQRRGHHFAAAADTQRLAGADHRTAQVLVEHGDCGSALVRHQEAGLSCVAADDASVGPERQGGDEVLQSGPLPSM